MLCISIGGISGRYLTGSRSLNLSMQAFGRQLSERVQLLKHRFNLNFDFDFDFDFHL